MEELKYSVAADEAGVRLDKYIALKLGDDYSRMYVKTLMQKGSILVNGQKVKHHYSVFYGDDVSVSVDEEFLAEVNVSPENIPIDIIYEDECLIIVDKASGMVVHPGAGNKTGTLVNAVLYHCGKLPETDDKVRPGVVHRLDKETSGIIVVAKNARALRSLGKQFQNRTVKKQYLALVRGVVEMDNGIVDVPLGRHSFDRKKMAVKIETGRSAKTIYHVKKRFKNFTFVELELETGRTHQIRVHMKYLGHPVLGDTVYGTKHEINRVALHAHRIRFTHPVEGKTVEFCSPMPKDMEEVIENAEKIM